MTTTFFAVFAHLYGHRQMPALTFAYIRAIGFIDGEFTVKRIKLEKDCLYLIPENSNYTPIKVTEENELIIWGIVTYVIKKM